MEIKVLLPLPLSPTRAICSPSFNSKSTGAASLLKGLEMTAERSEMRGVMELYEASVAHLEAAVAETGQVAVVGDDDESHTVRISDLEEKIVQLFAGLAIQIA